MPPSWAIIGLPSVSSQSILFLMTASPRRALNEGLLTHPEMPINAAHNKRIAPAKNLFRFLIGRLRPNRFTVVYLMTCQNMPDIPPDVKHNFAIDNLKLAAPAGKWSTVIREWLVWMSVTSKLQGSRFFTAFYVSPQSHHYLRRTRDSGIQRA